MNGSGDRVALSSQVSLLRAKASAGASPLTLSRELEQWSIRSLRSKRSLGAYRKQIEERWFSMILEVLRNALKSGAPVSSALSQLYKWIERDERNANRLRGVEQQYAFQVSLALILPWAAVAMVGSIYWNVFLLGAILMQVLGTLVFGVLFKRFRALVMMQRSDHAVVANVATRIWIENHSTASLALATKNAIEQIESENIRTAWRDWVMGGWSEQYQWPKRMSKSMELSNLVANLVQSGAPSNIALLDYLEKLEDEKQSMVEAEIFAMPVRLSLLLCLVFAPATFAILMGALWPLLSSAMTEMPSL